MRSPLDKACDDQRDAFQESISEAHKLGFKTGADWQLEQAGEKVYALLSLFYKRERITKEEAEDAFVCFMQSMRPTQGEQLQDKAVHKFMKNNSAALTKLADL